MNDSFCLNLIFFGVTVGWKEMMNVLHAGIVFLIFSLEKMRQSLFFYHFPLVSHLLAGETKSSSSALSVQFGRER
jgi:hypothetical protein